MSFKKEQNLEFRFAESFKKKCRRSLRCARVQQFAIESSTRRGREKKSGKKVLLYHIERPSRSLRQRNLRRTASVQKGGPLRGGWKKHQFRAGPRICTSSLSLFSLNMGKRRGWVKGGRDCGKRKPLTSDRLGPPLTQEGKGTY